MDGIFIGIGFGTISASISLLGKDSQGEVIANEDGERVTPCYVAFTEHEELAGFQAKVQAMSNPRNTISHFRNLLGLKIDDEETVRQSSTNSFRIVPHPTSPDRPSYQIETQMINDIEEQPHLEPVVQHYTVTDVTSKFLLKLKLSAEGYVGKPVTGCVISTPYHFPPSSKMELRNAAKSAGFMNVYTIHEPVAAALAFDQKSKTEAPKSNATGSGDGAVLSVAQKIDKMLLVIDLGAHQLNATIIHYNEGLYSILTSFDEFQLGGEHFGEVLVEFCVAEFRRKYRIDISDSSRSMRKLRNACEITKRTLSKTDVATLSVESLHDGIDFNITINRGRFEMLAEALFAQFKSVIAAVLKKADLTALDVDEVLLVGGSTRIPRLQSLVKSLFPNRVSTTAIEPDEAITLGCAIQAGIILANPNIDYAAATEDNTLLRAQYVSSSIGIEILNGTFGIIIPRKSPIPLKRTIEVSNLEDNQKEYYLAIYEGESPIAKDNTLLAEVVLGDLPMVKAGMAKIHVSFVIEKDGVLNVAAHEETTGRIIKVKLDHISK